MRLPRSVIVPGGPAAPPGAMMPLFVTVPAMLPMPPRTPTPTIVGFDIEHEVPEPVPQRELIVTLPVPVFAPFTMSVGFVGLPATPPLPVIEVEPVKVLLELF